MSGAPARFTHRALGGNRADVMRVTDPKRQVGASTYNAVQWQVAAMNRTMAMVTLTVAANGDRTSGAEAWNDLDDPTLRVTITHDTTGQYQIAAEPAYPDENGVAQPVEFHGALISLIGSTADHRPPTFTLDSPTQITIYTWNAAGAATDMAFTVDVK